MEDRRNHSYHFFHCCAVRDRVDLSHLSCEKADTCFNSFKNMVLEILPSFESDTELINTVVTNFAYKYKLRLVQHILCIFHTCLLYLYVCT